MCSAAARALPAGARGWRAARDVTAARARAAGEGEARAARPAACVLSPRAPRARQPRLLAARRAPPPAAWAARDAERRRAARGGGASLERFGRPGPRRRRVGGRGAERWAPGEGGRGALGTGRGSRLHWRRGRSVPARPCGDARTLERRDFRTPSPSPPTHPGVVEQGVFPLAGWGRRGLGNRRTKTL